jgi:cytosine deaminase
MNPSAARRQKTYRDTVLYTTLMPPYLGAAAVVQWGIGQVVAGDAVNVEGGAADFLSDRGVEVIDLHDADCIRTLGEFISAHAGLWRDLTDGNPSRSAL